MTNFSGLLLTYPHVNNQTGYLVPNFDFKTYADG